MEFPFKFSEIETFAENGRISARHQNEDGAFLQINYDADNFSEILRNLKSAHREAKRQIRFKEKFERWQKRHKEINQD